MRLIYLLKMILFNNLSLSKTLRINFKMLSFKDAIKLPIFVYQNYQLKYLQGKILIDGKITTGMIKIGVNIAGYVTANIGSLRLLSESQFLIKGNVRISQGANILVNRGSKLVMGENSLLGDNAKIICYKMISIGVNSEITWESQVTDFNSHYIEDMKRGKISNLMKPVHIGDYCWVGNRTTVMPGTVLPDRTIIASNSLLNKDYIKAGIESYSLIGGQPAKLIRNDVKRIYDREQERMLHKYFRENNCANVDSSILDSLRNE